MKTSSTKKKPSSVALRPFRITIPEEDLVDLRRRVVATRWPDKETVTDESQGVQFETTRKLAQYWATEYDWGKCQAKLNALPQFITEIDGLDIHFIHDFFYKKGLGYANEMALRPQTLYAIADSPVGLAAWILDHDASSYAMMARAFDGKPEGLTRDDILDNITLYWLTNTAISSARLYWENNITAKSGFFDVKNVTIPVAVSVFPDEIYAAPRSWAEWAYPKLIHYNQLDKGTHFAAWEQPHLFSEEIRVGFRSLR